MDTGSLARILVAALVVVLLLLLHYRAVLERLVSPQGRTARDDERCRETA